MNPPAVTGRKLHFTVDNASGVDVGRRTDRSSFKTVAGVEARIPYRIEHDVLIDLVPPGPYVLPDFRERVYGAGQIYVRALPSDADVVVPSTPAGSGSSTASIKGTFSVDEHVDLFVHVLSGAAVGDLKMVKHCTTTDLIPVRPFTAAVASGDRYEIVRPTMVLDASNRPLLHGTPGVGPGSESLVHRPTLNFENFVFSNAVGIVGRVALWRCATQTSSLLLLAESGESQYLLGVDGIVNHAILALGGYGPAKVYPGLANKAYLGAGLAHHYDEEPEGGSFVGYVNSSSGLFVRSSGWTQLMGGFIRGDHFTAEGPTTRMVLGGDPLAQINVQDGQASGTLRVRECAHVELRSALIEGAGTIAVAVESGGVLDILGSRTFVQITGAQTAIWCRRGGGRAFTRELNPAVTGLTNFAVGESPAVASSFPNVGDVLRDLLHDDGSLITRVE